MAETILGRRGPRTFLGPAQRFLAIALLLLLGTQALAGSLALAWDPVNDPRVAGYKVHYGTSAGNYTAQIDAGNVATSTVPNLADGATYYFAVTAYDGSLVQSGFSNEVVGTVSAGAPVAPVANFTASTTTGTAPLAMNFTSTSTGSITSYAWDFGDGTNSSSQNPAKTYSTVGTYTVSLTVSGTGGSNTKSVPNYITVTVTAAADTTPPTAPSSLTATVSGTTGINLAWTTSTDNVGVTGYRVERCQGASCTNFVQIATPSGPTFGNTGLAASTTYRYRVRAIDAAGNLGAYSAIATATTAATSDTTPPTVPSGFSATTSSSTSTKLAWTASTDNVGVTGYRVERCQGASCTNFAQIAWPTSTTFSNTGLAPSTTYR
ncbi:MAG: depolymerase family esterase, partial [Deltaproteobacteria bacterium]|nr:depolymerase family esterase [Deltaproteobacteria bacterium]